MSTKQILIVEDQPVKAQALKEQVERIFPLADVLVTTTIAIAGRMLGMRDWNGILLDLAFHRTQRNLDQLDRSYLAGVEILQQLQEMRMRIPVIVTTQHDSFVNTKYGNFKSAQELADVLLRVFPTNFKGLIQIDLGKTAWKDSLDALMLAGFR